MRKYDQIVVGAGIGGMTLAVLLGLRGKRVLLLEKGPRIGGSMLRFTRRGIPFDTGFHFTGGFVEGGVLADMLEVLGIADVIEPDLIQDTLDNRFVFERSGNEYALPVAHAGMVAALKNYFPGQATVIDQYFERVDRICENTLTTSLRAITQPMQMHAEDSVTLAGVLDGWTDSPELKSILAAYCTCYGVPPDEASFANHSRICHGLYHSFARVKGGGQAFAEALSQVLTRLDVDIRCGTSIQECADVQGRRVGRFVLSSGEDVAADDCVFTIHPRSILETLPRAHLHKAFVDRVEAMEPSLGFFGLYGVVREDGPVDSFPPAIISLLPSSEMADLFRPSPETDRVTVILKHRETVDGRRCNVLTALEASEPADVAEWAGSTTGRRPASYGAYKQERRGRIERRILATFPEYAGRLEVLETASMLTFRDHLHSPWGCAYGVRQKIGQFNLIGRLPLANLHAAGQSAMLPGVVGAMLSSFAVARGLVGREEFGAFIEERLPARLAGGRA